jgi:hypothetical protein
MLDFKNKFNLSQIKTSKPSVTPGNYVCCDCLKLFNTLEDMQRHNEKVHP